MHGLNNAQKCVAHNGHPYRAALMGKLHRNGRSKTRVVLLPYPLLESEAWACLPPPACKIFIELRRRYNGRNNGDISLSYREAAKVSRCSKSSALRHMEALISHGFIDLHNKGMMRNRHATTWYLTMEKCEYHTSYPTNRWREFKKPMDRPS
jgi:hypothetical protein